LPLSRAILSLPPQQLLPLSWPQLLASQIESMEWGGA
jgi:hypothetical protein